MVEDRLQVLFSLVTRGDEEAEREVFTELRPRLSAIAFGRGVASSDIEDVVQETLAVVFEQLRHGRFQQLSTPSTWVIGILLKKVADHFRRRGRLERLLATSAESHEPPSHISRYSRQDVRLEVLQALARLTPTERFVLTGTELAGLTYEEVATRLKCPAGTVASTKNRAVAKFREFFRGPRRPELKGAPDGDV